MRRTAAPKSDERVVERSLGCPWAWLGVSRSEALADAVDHPWQNRQVQIKVLLGLMALPCNLEVLSGVKGWSGGAS